MGTICVKPQDKHDGAPVVRQDDVELKVIQPTIVTPEKPKGGINIIHLYKLNSQLVLKCGISVFYVALWCTLQSRRRVHLLYNYSSLMTYDSVFYL